MRVCYSDDYYVPLPEDHPFPMGKFPGLYRILQDEGLITNGQVITPDEAAWGDLLLVHTREYLERLAQGTLERKEEKRIGVPWSPGLAHRSRVAVQGTIQAAHMALEDGIAANLAGGTHHAFPDHGEGFCVLNDVAVAIRVLQRERVVRRVLVVDLDVHQGNGTAAIFAGDASVYTFSMHGEKNYPWRKPPSTCDVGLPDGLDDAGYMDALIEHLPRVIHEARPDLIFYLAGVDPVQGDRFGRLAMTRQGIHQRDRFVLEMAWHSGLPIALVMAGGYASSPHATADLHAIVHREARAVYG